MAARPDVLNHNLETVPRLYLTVRPGARYYASLRLLEQAVGRVGANSEKVRNLLASGDAISGLSFLSTGELRTQ